MNLKIISIAILLFSLPSCSQKTIRFDKNDLKLVNRNVIAMNSQTLELNNRKGDGLAILENIAFEKGSIVVEIKGENNPGKSFVGVAFNIQNDSTYEAVYFRPFNFRSEEKLRREHSMQYISHPKNTWRFLRTNFEGEFEAEFPRQPDPTGWFRIRIEVKDEDVLIYDLETNTELLSVKRLEKHRSNKIGLWTGFDSKGWFRNLSIQK